MGKGGGALSMWLKEFTALIFTQTIQAFIYAIVISVILFGMEPTSEASAQDNNAALGLMATFALLSVFKVEDMAKKIFGIGDTKASHGNAMRSLAKTAIAAQLGKRVLNNVGKVFGGAKAWGQAGQDRRKLKGRMEEDLKDEGFELKDGKLSKIQKAGGGSSSTGRSASSTSVGSSSAGGGSSVVGGASSSAAGGDDVMTSAAYRRAKAALRNYQDKASEINKSRNEGIKTMISGLVESQGSIFGAATGAVIGGADGDLDEALQGMMAGAGVGDAIGEAAVNSVNKAIQFVERQSKRQKGVSNRNLQKSFKELESALNNATVNYHSAKVDDIDI